MMATTIRPARLDDASTLADIYNTYVAHSTATFETALVDAGEMRRRIAALSPRYPYLVCKEGGMLAGYCYAHPWKERAAYAQTWETTVYLHPAHTNRGLGQQLMEALMEECRRQGVHILIACITAENTASRAFHERLGFRQVSLFREVGRKFGRWLDVTDYEYVL